MTASIMTRSAPLSLLTHLTLTPPHTQVLDEPSAVSAAERQQQDKECMEGIEEAKGVAARWETGGRGGGGIGGRMILLFDLAL